MSFRDRFSRSKRKPSTRRQRIGFAFFWLVVLAYAYIIPLEPNWNSDSHLFLTYSIVDHHSLNIDPYHVRLGDESYYQGHYYTDKAPGLSFLAVPAYAGMRLFSPSLKGQGYIPGGQIGYAAPRDLSTIRYSINYLLIILPSAVFAVLLWLLFSRLIGSDVWGLIATAVYAFGTIAYVYSTQFFSHQVSAILLFGAFLLIFQKVRPASDQNARSPSRLLLYSVVSGLLAGYAVIGEYPTILIAALLALYLGAVSEKRVRSLGAFLLGAIGPAVLNLTYNLLAFGKPFALGYAYVHSQAYQSTAHPGPFGLTNPLSYGIQTPSLDSLWQITFGTYRGIFLVSPVLLLFIVGLFFMWNRRDLRPEFWLCLSVVVLYFLVDSARGSGLNGWSGGWSVASRHLTPVLPFMFVPMALAFGSRIFRLWFLALGAISIAITFMAVAAGDQFDFTDHNPLLNEALPRVVHGSNLIGNWGMFLGLRGMSQFLPFLVLAVGLVARIAYLLRHQFPERRTARALVPELEVG